MREIQDAQTNRRIGKAVAREQAWEELDKLEGISKDAPILETYKALQAKNQQLQEEITRLQEENKSLKLMLARRPLTKMSGQSIRLAPKPPPEIDV